MNCPLCKDEELIRVPHSYGSEFWYYGDPVARIIDPGNIHVVKGDNCWENGVQAYRGRRVTTQGTNGTGRVFQEVFQPGFTTLLPQPSQELVNHSPDGFSWGYAGSGPAQLALAILLDHTKDEGLSLKNYQLFKEVFVVHWGQYWQVSCRQLNFFYQSTELYWEVEAERRDGQMEQMRAMAEALHQEGDE